MLDYHHLYNPGLFTIVVASSKSVNDTIDDNSHDNDSRNIDSLKLKDIRSWCSPCALHHGHGLERFGENNEI